MSLHYDIKNAYFKRGFPLHLMDIRQGTIPEHSHEFYEMVYVRSGRGVHGINGVAYPIQAGDLYIISPGERHHYAPAPGSDFRIVNLLWTPSLIEELLNSPKEEARAAPAAKKEVRRARKSGGTSKEHGELGAAAFYMEPLLQRDRRFAHRLHLSGRTAYRVEALLDEMRREQTLQSPGHEVLLRHLFCALLVLLSRAQSERMGRKAKANDAKASDPKGNEAVSADSVAADSVEHENTAAPPQSLPGKGVGDTVARAIEFLEANHARQVRVEEVASHVAVSPSRLAHLFKERTGRGLIEYLHELRIGRACAALLETDASIQTVAATCGYADARFFHRMFRRHTGCNPGQYRRHFGAETPSDAMPWARG